MHICAVTTMLCIFDIVEPQEASLGRFEPHPGPTLSLSLRAQNGGMGGLSAPQLGEGSQGEGA